MYDEAKDLIAALASTPETLGGLLQGVSQEQAQAARGGDEGWSVVEVTCHLRDAEERALERMRTLRDQDDPLIAGYDQEAWARERNYAADDLRAALAAFARFRQQHVAELAALTAAQWEHVGRHEEIGAVTIRNHTLHIASHDAVHLAQIGRQLRR